MSFFPEGTFPASGIDLTDSGRRPQHAALDIEIMSVYYCRAAQRSGCLLSDAGTRMWYIIDWARSEAWKHDIFENKYGQGDLVVDDS